MDRMLVRPKVVIEIHIYVSQHKRLVIHNLQPYSLKQVLYTYVV